MPWLWTRALVSARLLSLLTGDCNRITVAECPHSGILRTEDVRVTSEDRTWLKSAAVQAALGPEGRGCVRQALGCWSASSHWLFGPIARKTVRALRLVSLRLRFRRGGAAGATADAKTTAVSVVPSSVIPNLSVALWDRVLSFALARPNQL